MPEYSLNALKKSWCVYNKYNVYQKKNKKTKKTKKIKKNKKYKNTKIQKTQTFFFMTKYNLVIATIWRIIS
jgi:hypothetical protein